MPKTPLQNPAQSDDVSDDKHTNDVAGRNEATDLARQRLEEAYANDPPNKQAQQAAEKLESEENDEEEPISQDGEIRIEHEEKGEPGEDSSSNEQSSWRGKEISNDSEKNQQPEEIANSSQNEESEDPKEKSSVYDRSHDDSAAYSAAAKQWQSYHSSWQQYYQQYYERYYLTQMKDQPNKTNAPNDVSSIISSEKTTEAAPTNEIRSQLLSKAQERAKAVRKSRHFMPILTALCVGLLFTFLQFNRLLIAQVQAYISPGDINPQNIVVDPTADVKVGPEPRLIIPKINVDAPLIFGVNSYDEPAVQEALKKGVVDYPIPGADAKPGQVGNMPILGHSSNDVFDDGAYKFVFVQLSKLNEGDTFYIHYKSIRYTYSVTSKDIIDPTEVSKLAIDTDVPMVTLITCEPPGTALKRLIVTAKQISPDPVEASKPESNEAPKEKPKDISGNSPTVLQRLFQ